MKPIKLLFLIITSVLSISCSAQRTLSEVSSINGVTSVYIGKTALKIAGTAMAFDSDKSAIDMSKIVKDLTSVEIINCEDKSVAEKVKKKCEQILSPYPFELITEVKNDDQSVVISGVFDKGEKYINMLLISADEDDNTTFILLKGKIDIETLTKAIIDNK